MLEFKVKTAPSLRYPVLDSFYTWFSEGLTTDDGVNALLYHARRAGCFFLLSKFALLSYQITISVRRLAECASENPGMGSSYELMSWAFIRPLHLATGRHILKGTYSAPEYHRKVIDYSQHCSISRSRRFNLHWETPLLSISSCIQLYSIGHLTSEYCMGPKVEVGVNVMTHGSDKPRILLSDEF